MVAYVERGVALEAPEGTGVRISLRELAVHAFYNGRLILGMLAAGLALGIVGALATPPQYVAEGLLLIRANAGEAVRQGLPGAPAALAGDAVQRIVQSDVQILQSEPVLRAAVGRVAEARAPSLPGLRGARVQRRPDEARVAAFRKRLRVSAETNSNIVRVTFRSPDRALAIRSVQAVIDAYAERRAGLYVDGGDALQAQEARRYAGQIAEADTRIAAVRQQFGVLDIAQDMQLAATRLDALSSRADQARERLAAVRAELDAARQGLAATPARVFDSQDATNATPNDDARNTLLRLRQEREHVASQYADGWPGLVELDRKIAAAEAQLASNIRDSRHSDRMVRNPVLDDLNKRDASLRLEGAALQRQLGELAAQIAAGEARIASLREADAQLRELGRTRELAETLYNQLSVGRAGARLQDEAVDDRSLALRTVQPPSAPLKPKWLGPTFVLAGLVVGLGLAVAAVAAATVLRQVFITPQEAERALRLPNLVDIDAGEATEGVRRLATLLVDARIDGRPATVVQVLSPDTAPKSRLALQLARSLAQDHGARTLLLDVDGEAHLRRRTPAAAVRRDIDLGAGPLIVVESATPGLWIAADAAGSVLADARLPQSELKGAIGALAREFGRVVIAGPADFGAYPARRLYPLADANLLIVEAERTRAPAARRLAEVVLSAGGDLLGFAYVGRRRLVPEALYRWL